MTSPRTPTRRDALAALAGVGAALAGCSGRRRDRSTAVRSTVPSDDRTVTDAAGRTVTLPSSIDRAVALGPGALRLLAYVGATDVAVGAERSERRAERPGSGPRPYALANPALDRLPSVGPRGDPAPARVRERNPDVVLRAGTDAAAADALRERVGAPVVVVDPGGVADGRREALYEALRIVGDVVRRRPVAESLIGLVEQTVRDLRSRATTTESDSGSGSAETDAPRAYAGYLGPGEREAVQTNPTYPPFALVRAHNVAAAVSGERRSADGRGADADPRVAVDPERLRRWNPTHVFVDRSARSVDSLASSYPTLDAVRDGEVYGLLPAREYGVDVATALANAYAVGATLVPDGFEDVDPAGIADGLYERFVGDPVYGVLSRAYGGGFGRVELDAAATETGTGTEAG